MRVSHLSNYCQYWIPFLLAFLSIMEDISDVLACVNLVISEADCLSHVHRCFYLFYELFIPSGNFSLKEFNDSVLAVRNPCVWKALTLCRISSSLLFAFNCMCLTFEHFLFLVVKSVQIFLCFLLTLQCLDCFSLL